MIIRPLAIIRHYKLVRHRQFSAKESYKQRTQQSADPLCWLVTLNTGFMLAHLGGSLIR